MWSLSSHNFALRMHAQFFLYITNQNSKTNMIEREKKLEWENELIIIYGEKEQYEAFTHPLTQLQASHVELKEGEFGDIINAGDISRGKRWLVSVKEEKELGTENETERKYK